MTKSDITPPIHQERWWRDWFNDVYLDVYAHRDDSGADEEVRTTINILPLVSHHNILDLCCGNGRHCRALHRMGYQRIIGIDYSYPLLKHAISEKPRVAYIRSDMRILPLQDSTCDAVLSYFTSFGYFKTNVENLEVLHEISRVLKKGGWFLLDYLNPNYIRKRFVPETTKNHGEYIIREFRSFSDDGERIEKEILMENWGGEKRKYFESVRLYEFSEMTEMLQSADLSISGSLGSFDGQTFNGNTPRMILYGSRA